MLIDGTYIEADLEAILGELQAQLHMQGSPLLSKVKPSGDNVMVTCIYHKGGMERRPSAGIKKDTGVYHCMACGEVHSLPEFIANCFGYASDVTGWSWLRKHFLSVSLEERKPIELDIDRNMPKFATEYVQEDELDKFRYLHPYMYKRGLNDQIIELFDIGYDSATNCITFPIRDEKGNVLFVARRSVATKYFNYPSKATKPLYGMWEYETCRLSADYANYDKNTVVVCESMLDALVVWGWGYFAVAMNGLGTDLQYKQLERLPCRKLILATDNDIAGAKARRVLQRRVRNKIITQFDYASFPPNKKDMNDLTREEFLALREIF